MVRLLFLFLLSTPIYSANLCEGDGFTGQAQLNSFNENLVDILKEEKPWSAASIQEVKDAKCRKKAPSLSKIKKYLRKNMTKSKNILSGLEITDDPKIIASLEKLLNKKKSILNKNIVQTNLKEDKYKDCKDALCISEKAFGKKLGPKLLYLMHRYGLNGSHLVFEQARPWGEKEIDSYIRGIQDMPSFILPMNHNKMCIHDKEENGRTMANASITFFSGLDDKESEEKEYTTYHELSHYISGELEIDHNPEWLELSGWDIDLKKKWEIENAYNKSKKKTINFNNDINFKPSLSLDNKPKTSFLSGLEIKTKNNTQEMFEKMEKNLIDIQIFHQAMVPTNRKNIISKYGETNPAEDFAETMSAYRFKPELLKEISPKKYAFIRDKVFGGIEFTSRSKCKNSSSEFYKYLNEAKKWKQEQFETLEDQKKDYLNNLDIDPAEKSIIENAILNYSI